MQALLADLGIHLGKEKGLMCKAGGGGNWESERRKESLHGETPKRHLRPDVKV